MHIYVIKVGKEASKHLTENAFCDRFYSKKERERERERERNRIKSTPSRGVPFRPGYF